MMYYISLEAVRERERESYTLAKQKNKNINNKAILCSYNMN